MQLSDARWAWPLLKAVAEGGTLQCYHPISGWVDFSHSAALRFENPNKPEHWRIKPKQPEYRLFEYNNGWVSVAQRNCEKQNTSSFGLSSYDSHVKNGIGKWLTPWLPLPNQGEGQSC